MTVPIDVGQLKALIVDEINDASGRVSQRIDTIWALYQRYAGIDIRLQYQYALVKAIDIALGYIREDVNFSTSGDLTVSLQQKFANLMQMRDNAAEEIEVIKQELKGTRSGVIAQIERVAPIQPLNGAPDANSLDYSGSAYKPASRGG